MSDTLTDQYQAWRYLLAGEEPAITEDRPESGFWRTKDNDVMVPVAIWRDADGLHVLVNGQPVGENRIPFVWPYCARYPIAKSVYDSMIRPKEVADPVYSQLPAGHAELTARATALAALPVKIETESDAMRIADALHVAREIAKRAKSGADTEKEPHDKAIKEIRGRWSEAETLAKASQDALKAALLPWCREHTRVKGQLAKAVSIRSTTGVTVTDYAAALAHFAKKDPEAFKAVVEKLAKAEPDAPGCATVKQESVQ